MKPLETPIAFAIFNRPDLTQRVFDEIKKAQPKKLFVISDGARNDDERKIVDETRKIIDQVDWECEVHKNYSDKNLGCKMRMYSGISWFFENVEQGIILEDDCVPSPSFFSFCEELLNKYKDDERVMMMSGDSFLDNAKEKNSYYFSKNCFLWGWATWRQAWQQYDINMRAYPKFRRTGGFHKALNNTQAENYWMERFDRAFFDRIDTWDYHWLLAIWSAGGLCINPYMNLVSNIGFDDRATHTTRENKKLADLPTRELNFPLVHPETFKIDKESDDFTNRYVFETYKQNKIKHPRLKRMLIPLCGLYKKLASHKK